MLVFIANTPLSYAWGSPDALPEMLGTTPTGEPQAELWLGAHPGSPATLAKSTPAVQTLIDLIESDPDRYGVDGAHLPFLLKILGIGQPLSLQVHPDLDQAAEGFALEEAAGVPIDAFDRRYRDPNHKPEMLVALGDGVTALCGFRSLSDVRRELHALALLLPAGEGREVLAAVAERLRSNGDAASTRRAVLTWLFSSDASDKVSVSQSARALAAATTRASAALTCDDTATQSSRIPAAEIDEARVRALATIHEAHPGDPGALVSMLLHLVHLAPGEALFLGPRQLHAYLSGIGVEVMASSDNVLRAGLTTKFVDVGELSRVVDAERADSPRIDHVVLAPGLVAWQPPVADFRLLRARVAEESDGDRAAVIVVEAHFPLVLLVTEGRVRVERDSETFQEVAGVRRGQSVYISAGESVVLTGAGEAFLATVGTTWPDRIHALRVS